MSQFYPDGVRDIAINRANGNGGLVTPPEENFNTDAMQGSMQQILSDNLGTYVVCEFLVGTQAMTRKEGILYSVGRSYLALYEENSQTFIVCDIFSVKFVTFYLPGQRPGRPLMDNSEVPAIQMPSTNRGGRGYRSMGGR